MSWAMHLTLNGYTTLAHGQTFDTYEEAMSDALLPLAGGTGWADYMGELAVQDSRHAIENGATLAEWLGVPESAGLVWGWRVTPVRDGVTA